MAYITYVGRHIKEIACKGCRKMIAARRSIAQNLRLDLTPDYSVMEIEMRDRDGQLSKHQTPMCRQCHTDLAALDVDGYAKLAVLYAEDMEQHYKTTVLMGYPPADVKKMVARFSDRVPLRVL
jgi:hypothetical protein